MFMYFLEGKMRCNGIFFNISVELKVVRMYKCIVSRFKSPLPQGSYIKLKDGKVVRESVQW